MLALLVSAGACLSRPSGHGATDGLGNLSEYKITTDAAGTQENIGFHSASGSAATLVSAVTIKPR